MQDLENAVYKMVRCLGISEREKITLIYDRSSAKYMYSAMGIIRPDVIFNLDNFIRPLDHVPKIIAEAVSDSGLTFYAIEKKAEGRINEIDFRRKLNRLASKDGRLGNLLSVSPEVLISAFSCNTKKVRDFTLRLQDYLNSLEAVIVGCGDSELTVELDQSWEASTGYIDENNKNVMPAEVYTKPADSNGSYVINGMYGHLAAIAEFNSKPLKTIERLRLNPIKVEVRNNRITDIRCNDREILDAVQSYVFKDTEDGSNLIDEIGIGTNQGIKKLTGVVMHDEKHPGVHIANGNHYAKGTVKNLDHTKAYHSDGIILGATMQNAGTSEIILYNGRFNAAILR